MSIQPELLLRLQFLVRVVQKECAHLATTDQRLFAAELTPEVILSLDENPELSERVEAFVGRFSRLQDTLGDKLLPVLLSALGERKSALIDNLDRAESLGFLVSTDNWLTMRNLRNQMVHEYIEDPKILASALQAGHNFVPEMIIVAEKLLDEIRQRGWLKIFEE